MGNRTPIERFARYWHAKTRAERQDAARVLGAGISLALFTGWVWFTPSGWAFSDWLAQ